uniref:NTR domain-containing protein n=1 Tax=Cyprinus carpio TaxID=7962 RepID=A0A8C1ZEJ2_CYPCA
MMFMTLPVIATHYLDSTSQWDTVGMERRNEAVNYINTGYQRQLNYRKSDGSYAAWRDRPSSTWLTAYVAKVFSMAYNIVDIEENVLCSALKWLILHKQTPDGSFKEDSAVMQGEMVGGIQSKDADASLTAFVVIAMQEAREICAGSVASLHESIRKAVSFLEGRLPQLTNPYAVAMMSYAMANAGKLNKDILMRYSSQHEGQSSQQGIKKRCFVQHSTVSLLYHGFDYSDDWSTSAFTQQMEINQFNVTARGTGRATLSVLTLYYARPVEKKSDCTFFDLTVKMEKDNEGTIASYKLTMDFIYKSDKTDATMTILDVGLPTGFEVEESDLKQLSSGKERYIQKYEKNTVLSERGSLILYLDKVSHKEVEVISFRMHQMYNVGLLQSAAVTIYEYYSPDARCTKFYHPERTDGAIHRLCKGDLCLCAEENCSYQKKNQVREEERLKRACEAGMDYAYKVTVVGMDLKQDSDIYDMKVEQVLREGADGEVQGKVRPFLARPRCREYLGLVKGKSYLIMGRSVDLPELGGSLQYVFGEQTWVEYWPTREESQTREHRERFFGINDLQNSLLSYGCAT